ncbi:alpha/beta hydrolase [Novosphingobium sp. CECT 9465]|uniref:alpha/beta hydrolase n=1 Tax=Novosphingobium sp. CECT 9465 TaxID=2829794 RepID=UPI001E4300C8|nr:alpha/beta hydrolase [Novosphingobium sp. CECT 9465]CAH0495276.1 Carboxylesterase NlhH [Novosphingobium sp. CECT 9465]
MMATIEAGIEFDPDVSAYLAMVKATARPSFEQLTVAQARQVYRAARDSVGLPVLAGIETLDDSFAGRQCPVAVRRYLPAGAGEGPAPVIMFLHGGGWVIGDLDTHDAICRHVAMATGLQVVSVDYRLAPEHPSPAAVEDCFDAHAMLINRARTWNVDVRRIVLMGDSAGGALAFATALHARDLCRPMPAAQVLFYPVCDLRGGTASYAQVRNVPITAATMAWFRQHYCTSPADCADWRNSPLLAESLLGLSPTFIAVAGHDPLRDEAFALDKRLRESGCATHMRYLPGHVHGFLTLGGLIGEAQQTITAAADFIHNCVA